MVSFSRLLLPKIFVVFFTAISTWCHRAQAIQLVPSSSTQTRSSYESKIGYHSPSNDLAKHLVTLRYDDNKGIFGVNHVCSGTIISNWIIITTAHAMTDLDIPRNSEKLIVVAGTSFRLQKKDSTTEHRVKRVLIHPDFVQKFGKSDLALVYLDAPLPEDDVHIQRIPLREGATSPGEKCIVYGWGEVLPDGPLADELIFTNVKIFKPKDCVANYYWTRGVICAGVADGSGRDTQKGDSGSPLVCANQLAGIVSYATPRILPSFYVDMSYYRDWILENGAALLSDYKIHCFLLPLFVNFVLN